jgi:hypothetical protein
MKIFGPLILDKNDASLKFVCEGQGCSRSQFLITAICVDFHETCLEQTSFVKLLKYKVQNKRKGSE